MKPLLLCCMLVLVCASGVAQFEGMIKSRNRSMDYDGSTQEYEMTIWVKKALVRLTIPQIGEAPGSTVIYRTDNDVSWILNDNDRTYFEVALTSRRDPRESVPSEPTSADKPIITRTQQTRKILGYLCEKVTIRKGDTETEVWGARGLKDLALVLSESLQPEEQSTGEDDVVAKMGLFPLRSVTRYEGRELESQEVTRIVRKPLPKELFQIPGGYKKQKAFDVQ